MKEVEAKFFVDVDEVEKKIKKKGYEIGEEILQVNYFVNGKEWLLRLRLEGNKKIFTLKYGIKKEGGIKKANEIEFEALCDFETAFNFLSFFAEKFGKKVGKYVKRVKGAKIMGVKVEITHLEGFGSYVEMEGEEEKIREVCEVLGIPFEKRSAKTVLELLGMD